MESVSPKMYLLLFLAERSFCYIFTATSTKTIITISSSMIKDKS